MKLSRRSFLKALVAIGVIPVSLEMPKVDSLPAATREQIGTEEHPYFVERWTYADWSIAQQHLKEADIPDTVLSNPAWYR